jgi:hypothetical protein
LETRSVSAVGLAVIAAVLLSPRPALAQHQGAGFLFREPIGSFALRAGYARPNASSDIYSFYTDQLTLSKGSFGELSLAETQVNYLECTLGMSTMGFEFKEHSGDSKSVYAGSESRSPRTSQLSSRLRKLMPRRLVLSWPGCATKASTERSTRPPMAMRSSLTGAASVRPLVSSMSCAYTLPSYRNTVSRGRSAVPATRFRMRRWMRWRRCFLSVSCGMENLK